jgi:ribonuclease HII
LGGVSKRKYEQQCVIQGYRFVAGVDEVGMGCLAGPVVAAACILDLESVPRGIDDSKLLTAKKREALDVEIRARAVCFGIGMAEVDEIDRLNIFHAARLAMLRAIQAMRCPPDFLLIDGRARLECPTPQLCIVKGDHLSVSIGAASILAKVFRDALMVEMDLQYPGYEFAKHKGYGSVLHRQHLQSKGPSPLHRKSFSWTPVRASGDGVLPAEALPDLEA